MSFDTMQKAAEECIAVLRRVSPDDRAYAIARVIAELTAEDAQLLMKVALILERAIVPG